MNMAITIYIENRQNKSKFKRFSSYEVLYLAKYLVLRNRLLFID